MDKLLTKKHFNFIYWWTGRNYTSYSCVDDAS